MAARFLLLLAFGLLGPGCAITVSHAKPHDRPTERVSETPLLVSVAAKSLFGWSSESRDKAQDDPDLQASFVQELSRAGGFVSCPPGKGDMHLDVLFREADDAGNYEGVGIFNVFSLGLIPEWYSRELVTEVTVTSRDGQTRTFTEIDSYTRFMWIAVLPLAPFFTEKRAFRDIAENQFRRVIEKL